MSPPHVQAPKGVFGAVTCHILPIFLSFFFRARKLQGDAEGCQKKGAYTRDRVPFFYLSRFPTPHDSDPLASLNPAVTTRSLQRPSGCAGSWSPSSGACRRCVVSSFFLHHFPIFLFNQKKTNPFSQLSSLVTAMKKRFCSHPPEKHKKSNWMHSTHNIPP